MKRIITAFLFVAMVAAGVSAIEYGALLDSNSSFEKVAENDFAFSQKLDASAYVRVPFTKDGRVALSTEFAYRFQYADEDMSHFLNLPLLKVGYSGGVGSGYMDIAAGRFTMSDNTRKIFNQTSDGLFGSFATDVFVASMYFGYTGLVNRYFVSMVETGIDAYTGFESDFYTSSLPYMVVGANVGLNNLFLNQNVGLSSWGFVGIQEFDSNKVYGAITFNGAIVGNLFHSTEGIVVGLIRNDTAEVAGLCSTTLSYYFDWLGLAVNAGATYASEKFETVTATSGMVRSEPWTNVFLPSLSVSMLPVSNLYVAVETNFPLAAKDMEYQGAGLVGSVQYQLFNDVALGVNVSQFFAKMEENNYTKISLRAAISF